MAVISPLYFVIMAGLIATTTAKSYCNIQSCNSDHTMCRYTSTFPSSACGQTYSVGLNDADRKAIVDKHNELRQKVASGQESRGNPGPQPAAARMPNLTWDKELETIAQRWAIQCNFNHDSCRNVDRFVVGQNIVQTMNSGENKSSLQSMIQIWYDEVDMFDRNSVSHYQFDSNTGHYTQLVWADTKTIGCGLIYYNAMGWNTKFLVCNYGPSGNWIGERIYEAIY